MNIKFGKNINLSPLFFNYKLNRNPLLNLLDLGTPVNISYFWKFGSLLGLFCGVQIFSGFVLRMHYLNSIEWAFFSVKLSIQKEVFLGWFFHNVHRTGASFFFLAMYIHLFRGLYYGGFNQSNIWLRGVRILLISMGIGFLGYVLPWGQMSFWGATVITNFFSAIPYLGNDIVCLLWGGYGVGGPTLSRFFSLHFLLPFVMIGLAGLHVFVFLHVNGSSNPLGSSLQNYLKVEFFPYFVVKDFYGFFNFLFIFFSFVLLVPRVLLDCENYIEAKSLVTPVHIQPEWYFLTSYAILRSIPNKLGGVIALVLSVLFFYLLPFFWKGKNFNSVLLNNKAQWFIWLWARGFLILMYVGACPVEFPWVDIGALFSLLYFSLVFFSFFYLISLKKKY